jgi:ELWxxDGT repeat protein
MTITYNKIEGTRMLKLTRALAFLAALGSFCNAHAAVSLLKDINQGFYPGLANAANYVSANGLTFFVAIDATHGQELWCTDGTSAGTHVVRDIAPGPGSPGIERLTVLNNVVYFFANDGVNGVELWRSDGTLSGTHVVADIKKGAGDSIPEFPSTGPIASIGAVLYFAADDGTGLGLWRSDGTADGTYRVSDVKLLDGFVTANGQRVFFQGPGSSGGGGELWMSDGTAAGTQQLSNTFPSQPHSGAGSVTATSSGVFFLATDGNGAVKLLFAKPDGSALHIVSDLTPTVPSTGAGALTSLGPDVVLDVDGVGIYHADTNTATLIAPNVHPMNGFQPVGSRDVFSVGSTGDASFELWTTDGTAAGTHQLGGNIELRSNAPIGSGAQFAPDGGFVYFGGLLFGTTNAYGIWKTDGTDAGTTQYVSPPGSAALIPTSMARLQGKMFFDYPCGTSSECLWSSDGTPSGTSMVFDPAPDSAVASLAVGGSALFFITEISAQLFTSDGSTAGTHSLVTLSTESQGSDSQASGFTSLGSKVLFTANDGIHGYQIWQSDKSTRATSMLTDLNPSAANGVETPLVAIGALIMFGGNDGIHGEQLWVTDGTVSGTAVLANVTPELDPFNVALVNGVAFFAADDGVHGFQPWRSDGTAAGTYMVADIGPAAVVGTFRAFNGQVMFFSQTLSQWWISDGTAQGTHAVTQAGTASGLQVTFNGLFYFGGVSNGASTGDLWVTDGTLAGTHIALSFANEYINSAFGLSGRIVLQTTSIGPTNVHVALYGTDGTSGGTTQVATDSFFAAIAVNNQLFYSTPNSDGSTEIRATDGTIAGTRDIIKVDSAGTLMGAYKGTAIFSTAKFVPGAGSVGAIWRTDGTPQGTHLVASGPRGSWFQAIDNAVYFMGTTEATGAEPFVVDELSPNTAPDQASTSAETAVTIDVLANDGFLTSALVPSSVAISISPQNGSASIDPSTGKITYTPAKGFSGTDTFAYIVMDTLGQESSPTSIDVVVGAEAGPPPGSAPGGSTGGSSGGSTGSGSSKGGGGELSLLELIALCGLALLLRSAASPDAARSRGARRGLNGA